jgi:type I restriction enzyme, S subunit
MASERGGVTLADLLITTKDGDWGQGSPAEGLVPYRVIRGTDFPSVRLGDTSSVPVRFLRKETVHRRTLAPGDILLETAGGSPGRPTGRTLLITERLLSRLDLPATCASFARFLRVDPEKAEPSYVYWFLQYLYLGGQMEQHQVQHTGVARFQYTRFAQSQQIPLPFRAEQRAIAGVLGGLDDRIELNRRMNETLESVAQALYRAWFVDFDVVHAKAGGRDTGLPTPVSDLFPDRLEASQIGQIPAGWRVAPLASIADVAIGGDWGRDTPDPDDVEVRCLRGVDLDLLRRAGWSDAPRRFVRRTSLEKRRPSSLDILVEGSGECGRSLAFSDALENAFPEPVIYSNFCKRLSTRSASTAIFVQYVLNRLVETGEMKTFVTGTAMPNLDYRGLLSSLLVVVPPDPVLDVFGAFAEKLRKRLFLPQTRTLAAIRDALLPKLISGELRMQQAEGMLGATQI